MTAASKLLPRISRILVPTDLSPASLIAAEYAVMLATSLDASLAVLHVLAIPNELIGLVPGASVAEEVEAERATANQRLAEILATIGADGFTRIETLVDVASSPTQAIVARAHAGSFELIVMATHGRSAIGRMVLGSIAEGVLRHAHCPVLMIRPD